MEFSTNIWVNKRKGEIDENRDAQMENWRERETDESDTDR